MNYYGSKHFHEINCHNQQVNTSYNEATEQIRWFAWKEQMSVNGDGMRVDWDNENTKIPVSHKVENAKLQCNLEK